MRRDNPRAEDVIAHVDRRVATPCDECTTELLGHDAVLGLFLGLGDRSLCSSCLAAHHGAERLEFLERALHNVARLPCYRAGWIHADALLEAGDAWPEERFPRRLRMPLARHAASSEDAPTTALDAGSAAHVWDAGARGCGELALELKLRLAKLAPGERLLLVTTDLGALADLPAWCRLTGNVLVATDPPRFLVERGAPRS